MRPAFPREDTQPWYQQFWPWFLILLPASVVVAGFVMLYIANRGADDLVVDDYYKTGLAINRQLEKKQLSAELGISADLQFSNTHVTARITGPVQDEALNLLLSHPLEADRDFTVTLLRIAPGYYQATLPEPLAPRWHWTLGHSDTDAWRLDGAIRANDLVDARDR